MKRYATVLAAALLATLTACSSNTPPAPDYEAVARESALILFNAEPTAEQVQQLLPSVRRATDAACANRKDGMSEADIVKYSTGMMTAEQATKSVRAQMMYVCERQ